MNSTAGWLMLLGLLSCDELTLPPVTDHREFLEKVYSDPYCSKGDENYPTVPWHFQKARCEQHLKNLKLLRAVRGYEKGHWDLAITRTEFYLGYWDRLEVINDVWWGETAKRRELDSLRLYIGDWPYITRWHPPLFTSEVKPLIPIAPRVFQSLNGINPR